MTDAEIDAAIRAVVPAEYFAKINVGGTIYECAIPDSGARAIYRAGMREAARIVSGCWCGNAAAIEIEHAAGGEG
jgi:hypothetical protein